MTTLNVRQLRALSIIAPGTLALSGHTIGGAPFFLTTVDDGARSGIWGIAAYSDGSLGLYKGDQRSTEDEPEVIEYADLIERHEAAQAEEAAGVA